MNATALTLAEQAVVKLRLLYEQEIAKILRQFEPFLLGMPMPQAAIAYYPQIRFNIPSLQPVDNRESSGFVYAPGEYCTSVTQPDLFHDYLVEQIAPLIARYAVAPQISLSNIPIPLPFVLNHPQALGRLTPEQRDDLANHFSLPNLQVIDDEIVDQPPIDHPHPLALYTAPRIDISLSRLQHYTGTAAAAFQRFVLFTNYPAYVDRFSHYAKEVLQGHHNTLQLNDYTQFITPNYTLVRQPDGTVERHEHVITRGPQMPAYHLVRPGREGITLVNIGVGPSNAKTITDHIATLRPHAWLMLGHCGGLDARQRIGDYVLAHTYIRDDHVLDDLLPLHIPIPNLAEMEVALKQAIAALSHLDGYALKSIVRTGAVLTTANRNWEFLPQSKLAQMFHQGRAIAVDMESATIAANGYRNRIPYGTLLCVSDKPLHGIPKLPGLADSFYQQQIERHLLIGLRALESLIAQPRHILHSRKLRGPSEPPFR